MLMENIKTGLILEGGGMRGMFTCGVTDVMMENDITFDAAIGVSAGAAFGCNYKSKQPGRAVRYNTTYCRDPRYAGLGSLIKTGNFFNAEFCYVEIPNKLDLFDEEAFVNNPMEFYVVCTDIESGEVIYHRSGDSEHELEWFRASASLPLAAKPVEVDGKKLLDGGIIDSVPIQYFESIGYNKNVVILTQPKGFIKQKNKLVPVIRRALKQYPKVAEQLAVRHIRYNETTKYIEEREKSGEVLVIRPPEALDIKQTCRDPEELRRVYNIGRKTGEEMLEQIKAFTTK